MKNIIALIILSLMLVACGGKVPEGKRSLDVQYNGDSLKYESDTRKGQKDAPE